MSYTIREGVKDDCAAIEQLIKELAVYERMPDGPKIDRTILERDGFGDGPTGRLFRTFVAQLDDDNSKQIVGYALYFYKYSTWEGKGIWLEDLYVRPEYRGKSIGLSLFGAVANQAVLEDCCRLEWNCLDWNQSSICFYKKLNGVDLTESEGWHTFRLTPEHFRQLANKYGQQ
ncbi:thialysine N-epsilon-acetyltransferase-like [Oppia nitens]|uniref:thialysine N-epsilon-acetyltransferase-like n=1 Tax=Oppia nitens TaxID=1686743 RepID=UPI0023DB34D4|nr:thialysine N-epsilon-acetyltransferase-like [Oppia nitens]XP_054155426.1 thialysine N-epsilon-acetyltransferase-like [Oppia nitens]